MIHVRVCFADKQANNPKWIGRIHNEHVSLNRRTLGDVSISEQISRDEPFPFILLQIDNADSCDDIHM